MRPLAIAVLATAGLLALAALAVGVTWQPPRSRLPSPSGPHAVGVTRLRQRAIDPLAAAELAPEAAGPSIELWYPAAHAAQALVDEDALADCDAALIETPERLPLLLYFPGWPGTRIENHALIRELASQGYVVASLIYPAPADEIGAEAQRRIIAALERPADYSSAAAYQATVKQSQERVRKRAADASALLDLLLQQRAGPDLAASIAARIDPERIGIFGFSLGGAVAAQACTRDPRFKACVNLDGRLWAEARDEGLKQPRMLIAEPVTTPGDAELQSSVPEIRYNAREDLDDARKLQAHFARDGGLWVTIHGTTHMNFTDRTLILPWTRLTEGGAIDARRAVEITNRYVLAFFDRWLRGRESPLLNSVPADLPDVSLQAFPRAR